MIRDQCSCRVAYPADEPQTWRVRRCRRLAIIAGDKCWQHSRMTPCCPLHSLPIVVDHTITAALTVENARRRGQ